MTNRVLFSVSAFLYNLSAVTSNRYVTWPHYLCITHKTIYGNVFMGNWSHMHYILRCITHQRFLSYFWDSGYYVLIRPHLPLVEDQVLSLGRDTVAFTLIATNKTVSFCFCTHKLFFLSKCSKKLNATSCHMLLWPCITHWSACKNPINQGSKLSCYMIIPNRSAKMFLKNVPNDNYLW